MSRANESEYDSVLSGSSSDCIFCTSSLVIALFQVGFQNLPMLYCLNGLSVSANTFCLTALSEQHNPLAHTKKGHHF